LGTADGDTGLATMESVPAALAALLCHSLLIHSRMAKLSVATRVATSLA
jgi:hypothetical protein